MGGGGERAPSRIRLSNGPCSNDTKGVSGGRTHIRGLDGLRGLAVLAVVVFHLGEGFLHGGYLGVDVFFVLSGYLITSILLSEHERTGRIDLRRFWIRRLRRLSPALLSLVP
ncbi:MAG: acyltransferase, partial [Proteobacteria bacterium]